MTRWSHKFIDGLRQQTRGTRKVIHFNNAGASLMPVSVIDLMIEYLKEEEIMGGYETASRHDKELEGIYTKAATLLNALPEEIAFTENATVAWNLAFQAIPFEKGDLILTSEVEYASNYITFLHYKDRIGIEVQIIPSTISGEVDPAKLQELINPRVKLISVSHMPTNGGLVNPAEEIGQIARKNGVYYLLDACQSFGQYPLDVRKINCQFLSATGRKYLRGPRGTGILYVDREVLDTVNPPTFDLHAAEWVSPDQFEVRQDARKFENWEKNCAAKIGFNEALKLVLELGIGNIWERIQSLAGYFRTRLADIPGVTVTDRGKVKSGIVTFVVAGISCERIKSELGKKNIHVNVSSRASTLLDMENRGLAEVVRASIHYYNTESEIDTFIENLLHIIKS